MDPLAITVEIFVLTITGAIFGGMAMLIALDILADRQASKGTVISGRLLSATVHQIQPRIAQKTATKEAAVIPKAA